MVALAMLASMLLMLSARSTYASLFYTVNDTGDEADANPGDGLCDVMRRMRISFGRGSRWTSSPDYGSPIDVSAPWREALGWVWITANPATVSTTAGN